jgi:hypothetical protein
LGSEYVVVGPRPWEARILLDGEGGEEIASGMIRRVSNLLEKMIVINGFLLRMYMANFDLFRSQYWIRMNIMEMVSIKMS